MTVVLNKFSALVFNLYRGARAQPVDAFQDWSLDQIRPVLPFDSALWLTGTLSKSGEHAIQCTHLHKLPPQVISDWERVKDRAVFTKKVFHNPGVTLRCAAADEFGAELLEHSRRYNIEHLLATASIEPISGLNELISLYRSDPDRPFTEEERLFQQNLVPHLAETWRVNRMKHLTELTSCSCTWNPAMAAVDSMGVLHLAGPDFTRLVLQEWPSWSGPYLPQEMKTWLQNGQERFVGTALITSRTDLNDMLVLRARSRTQVDGLSKREREVAEYFSAGQTYKEIAKYLKLSPATVRNYLSTVYRKLEVNNKAELVGKLKESN